MKKVLFVSPSLVGAGAERVLCNILNNLDRSRFDVTLLLVLKADNKFLDILAKDIKVIDLASTKSLKANAFKVLNVVRKLKPDSVFVANGHLGLILSPFLIFFRKYKWVVRETNFVSKNVDGVLAKLFYRFFYANFDVIVAQCNDMAKDLIDNFKISSRKVFIINNPVDTDLIDLCLKNDKKVCLGRSDKINLLACGRLTYQKGFDMLIDCFSKAEIIDDYHLSIIGEGERNRRDVEEKLKQQVNNLGIDGKVEFLGYQDNVYSYLRSADVFVLSSRFEGFSNVLLEAIYCGTPVLVNNCPGGVAEVVESESIGLIYDFVNNDFQDKLNHISKLNFNEVYMKNYIKNKFGVEVIVKQYAELI